jgi:hypothetical protein
MNKPGLFAHRRLLVALLLLSARTAFGQVQITGTVYDESQRFAMVGVSVMGTSGVGTMTDSLGHYKIRLSSADSIFFSYLGKFTARFPVKDLAPGQPFDMALQVSVDSLPTAYVHGRNYLQDSLANRKEYAKVFDYQAHYLNNMKMDRRGGMGIGFDLDLLLNAKANRRMEAFQKRLEEEERDKYIDHRFTPAIVKKITGLETPALDTFMHDYRPTYEFIQSCATEYEFYHYIQEWGKFFNESWKENHPNPAPAKDSTITPSGSH